MKPMAKLFAILLMIAPVLAYSAVTIKADGQIRTRIIALTNENDIVDHVVKNLKSNRPTRDFNNTVVGISVTKQSANTVAVAVTF